MMIIYLHNNFNHLLCINFDVHNIIFLFALLLNFHIKKVLHHFDDEKKLRTKKFYDIFLLEFIITINNYKNKNKYRMLR